MEMFKVDDSDIQGRLEFNKEWWNAAQEGEPMAGDEIREVRWLIELAGKQHEENERLRKELEEARKIRFPRQPDGKYGWTIDFSLLRKIQQLKSEYPCNSTLEEIESVLLVLEEFWGQEGEGNQNVTTT